MTPRTFAGHFHGAAAKGERRMIVMVALPREDGDALLEALGPEPHRSKSLPVVLALGGAPDVVSGPRAHAAPNVEWGREAIVPSPAEPPPYDFGQAVAEIAELTVQMVLFTDAASDAGENELAREICLASRDAVARRLAAASDALNAHLAGAAPSRRREGGL